MDRTLFTSNTQQIILLTDGRAQRGKGESEGASEPPSGTGRQSASDTEGTGEGAGDQLTPPARSEGTGDRRQRVKVFC